MTEGKVSREPGAIDDPGGFFLIADLCYGIFSCHRQMRKILRRCLHMFKYNKWKQSKCKYKKIILQDVEAKYPAILFRQQITTYLEKIYGIIRDNIKKNMSPLLAFVLTRNDINQFWAITAATRLWILKILICKNGNMVC